MGQTAREFIKEALQIANIVDIYEDTTDSKYLSVGLSTLNREINSLNAVDLWPVSQREEYYTPSSNERSYTIGVGGDIDTKRPHKIFNIKYRRANIWYPMRQIDNANWNFLSTDTNTSGTPNYFRYLPEEPLGKIEFFITPDFVEEYLIIMSNPTGEYALDDEIVDVDGVTNALLYAVANTLSKRFLRDNSLEVDANKYMTRYKKSKSVAPEIMRGGIDTSRFDYKSGLFL